MSWWTRHRKNLNPYHAVNNLIEGANYEAEHVLGWKADPTGSEGGGRGPGDIYVGGTTSTDMGFNLEGKQTALQMGGMAPGEYTEMYGSNTAYNENNQQEKGTWDYVSDIAGTVLSTIANSALTNYYNKDLQHSQNKFNAQQAQLNRDWEERMANTAHQREYADLLATGLNPVNTATGGGGAATPGGSAASGTTPPYMNASDVGNTALSLAETLKALSENKYISKEKKAQIANTVADTAQKEAGTGLTKESTELTKEQTKQLKIDNITREDMNRIEMAFKQSQTAESQEKAIAQAIINAYHTETGTSPDMSMVEKATSIIMSEIKSQIKDGKPINPVGAIKSVLKRFNDHQ